MKPLLLLSTVGLCLAQDPNPRFAGKKTTAKERTNVAATLPASAGSVLAPQSPTLPETPSVVAELEHDLVLVLAAQTQFLNSQIAMMRKAQQYGCTLDQSMAWQCPKSEPKK